MQAHRWRRHTDAGRRRVFEHRWRCSTGGRSGRRIFGSFLSPVLFLAAMGIGLGGVRRDSSGTRRSAALSVPRSSSRPGCWRPRRCRRPRSSRPSRSWAGSSGAGCSTRCTRRRSRRSRHRLRQSGVDRDPDDAWSPRSSRASSSCSGRRRRRSIVLAIPAAVLTGARLRRADRRVHGDPADRRQVQRDLPVRDHAAVPASPARSSRSRALPASLQPLAWLTAALARRVADPGAVARARSATSRSLASPTWRSCWRSSWSGPGWRSRTVEAPAGARMSVAAGVLGRIAPQLALGQPPLGPSDRAQPLRLQRTAGSSSSRASSSRSSTCSGSASGSARSSATCPGPAGARSRTRCSWRPRCCASSAMNGAILEATFNFFFKLQLAARRSTRSSRRRWRPADVAIGELGWALIRGGLYAVGVHGRDRAVRAWSRRPWASSRSRRRCSSASRSGPSAMAATSFMRTWQDFDLIQLVILPLFLFSATFFPIETYPEPLRLLVQLTPLYHGVDLIRSLVVGVLSPVLLVHVAYLTVMGLVGLVIVEPTARQAAADVGRDGIGAHGGARDEPARDPREAPTRATRSRRSGAAEIIECRLCPRLVEWRERVAREKVARFRDEPYWGRPATRLRRSRTRGSSSWGWRPAAHGAQSHRSRVHRRRVGRLPVVRASRGRDSPTGRRADAPTMD